VAVTGLACAGLHFCISHSLSISSLFVGRSASGSVLLGSSCTCAAVECSAPSRTRVCVRTHGTQKVALSLASAVSDSRNCEHKCSEKRFRESAYVISCCEAQHIRISQV
jgi:hypothetical protein